MSTELDYFRSEILHDFEQVMSWHDLSISALTQLGLARGRDEQDRRRVHYHDCCRLYVEAVETVNNLLTKGDTPISTSAQGPVNKP